MHIILHQATSYDMQSFLMILKHCLDDPVLMHIEEALISLH